MISPKCPGCGHSAGEGCGCPPDVRVKRVIVNAISAAPMGVRTLIDLGAAMVQIEKREVVACIWDMVSDGILAYDMSATVSLARPEAS